MRKQNQFYKVTQNVGYITSKKMLTYWLRLLSWSLQENPSSALRFGARLASLWDKNGLTFTVQYLKECTRLFQHFIAGRPEFLSLEVPVGIAGGLPSIIPGDLRSRIRDEDPGAIRLTFTVLSVYRVLRVPGKLKLNSITDPFKGDQESLTRSEITRGLRSFFDKKNVQRLNKLNPVTLVRSGSAGPNSSSSLRGLWYDIIAWNQNPSLKEDLFKFGSFLEGGSDFLNRLFLQSDLLDRVYSSDKPLYLGRLSLKEEAAGKVRVFAITDCVTQSLMAPLSDWIFSILKKIPTDGTFDQSAPLTRLQNLLSEGKIKGELYSYDLSSATDRLPILLQKDILAILSGNEDFASSWCSVMTSREWTLLKNKSSDMYISEDQHLKYSVGQPMGALSSWAMLALTHHVLVHIAAKRVNKHQFDSYALLGDDIVIGDASVAQSYHYLMTEQLGVEINLHKSLISEDSFEFAKRLIKSDKEFSPVGPKNLLVGMKSIKGIPSILLDLLNKGFDGLDEQKIRTMFSSIPGTSNKKARDMMWFLLGPFGCVSTIAGLSSQHELDKSLNSMGVLLMKNYLDRSLFEHSKKFFESNLNSLINTLVWLRTYTPVRFNEEEYFSLFEYDSIRELILEAYHNDLRKIIRDRPKAENRLNAFSVVDSEDFDLLSQDLMRFATRRFNARFHETLPSLNPFKNQVLLPTKHFPLSQDIWNKVEYYLGSGEMLRGNGTTS